MKRLAAGAFLKELVPWFAGVAVFRNPMVSCKSVIWQEPAVSRRSLGVTLHPFDVRGPEDFDLAFANIQRDKAQALLVFDDATTITHRARIVALAASNHLPAMYGLREFADGGGLMSYGVNFAVLFRRAASFVDKILRGAKPADLPIEQPTKFELIVNSKAAIPLGSA